MEINDDELDLIMSALAHETRRSVMRALAGSGAMTFSEMMQAACCTETGTFGFHFKKLLPLLHKAQDGGYGLSELGFKAVGLLRNLGSGSVESPTSHVPQSDATATGLVDEVTYIRNLKVAWINEERLQRSKGIVVGQCNNVLIDQDVDEQTAKDKLLSLYTIKRIDVPRRLRQLILSRVEREVADIVPYEGSISIDDYTDKVVKELENTQELEFYTEGLLSAKDLQKKTRIVIYNTLKVMDDVTSDIINNNVIEIVNYGIMNVPKGLKESLLLKMIENYGLIEEREQ